MKKKIINEIYLTLLYISIYCMFLLSILSFFDFIPRENIIFYINLCMWGILAIRSEKKNRELLKIIKKYEGQIYTLLKITDKSNYTIKELMEMVDKQKYIIEKLTKK